jgi:[ribosomal protein S18]-alanine N-acetyltransferase
MKVTLRKMTERDVPAVSQIDQLSFSLPWPEHSFRYEVSENRVARCFVAETEDHRIAAMIVSWIIVDEMHIATIATHPDFRRQGIGMLLLRQALLDGREAGARLAFLEVRAGNEVAQAMYRRFGFQQTGKRPRYYRDNGEDAILMTLEPLEIIWNQ